MIDNDSYFFKPVLPSVSPLLKTACGEIIHLKDVERINSTGFREESDTMEELSGTRPDENSHIWVKIGDKNYAVSLTEQYNITSMHLPSDTYYSESITNATERRITELWSTFKWGR